MGRMYKLPEKVCYKIIRTYVAIYRVYIVCRNLQPKMGQISLTNIIKVLVCHDSDRNNRHQMNINFCVYNCVFIYLITYHYKYEEKIKSYLLFNPLMYKGSICLHSCVFSVQCKVPIIISL